MSKHPTSIFQVAVYERFLDFCYAMTDLYWFNWTLTRIRHNIIGTSIEIPVYIKKKIKNMFEPRFEPATPVLRGSQCNHKTTLSTGVSCEPYLYKQRCQFYMFLQKPHKLHHNLQNYTKLTVQVLSSFHLRWKAKFFDFWMSSMLASMSFARWRQWQPRILILYYHVIRSNFHYDFHFNQHNSRNEHIYGICIIPNN